MPITNYQPSAEGARIVWARCDQAPPYMAEWSSGNLTTNAMFDVFEPNAFLLSFITASSGSIALDSTELGVTVDGKPASLDRLTYWTTSSKNAKGFAGPLKVVANTLHLEGVISKEHAEEVVVSIPRLMVNGELVPSRAVRFHREKKIKVRFLTLNC